MRKQRGGSGLWSAVVLTSLAVLGSPAAWAQVKLEYKFPEGEKLAYKTTSKTAQVLTLMGQGDQHRVEGDRGHLDRGRQEAGRQHAARSRRRWNRSMSSSSFPGI